MTARSPLAGRSADLDRIDARELAFMSQLDVRTNPSTAAKLGFPIEPNTATTSGDHDVLWLGPDEWLVVGEAGSVRTFAAELEASLGGDRHSLVDVSANRVVIELAGPSRHDLLLSACPIDLHPRSWGDGRCAQSVFGSAQVVLHEREETTRLFVRPSFADYVLDLLLVTTRP